MEKEKKIKFRGALTSLDEGGPSNELVAPHLMIAPCMTVDLSVEVFLLEMGKIQWIWYMCPHLEQVELVVAKGDSGRLGKVSWLEKKNIYFLNFL